LIIKGVELEMEFKKIELERGIGDYAETIDSLILRDNQTFQFSLHSRISENIENQDERVSFELEIYRKSKSESRNKISIRDFKAGDVMRIKLDRDEVFKLLSHGDILQQIAIEHGMPSFRSSYLKVSDYNFFNFGKDPVSLERIVRFIQNNLNQDPDIFDFFESYTQKFPRLKDLKNISRLSVLLEESQIQDIDFEEIKSLISLLKDCVV